MSEPAPASPKPAPAAPAAPPAPPPPDPTTLALRDEVLGLLGPSAAFEPAGKLPAFRVAPQDVTATCRKLRDAGFDHLVFVTATDYPAEQRFEMTYALASFGDARTFVLLADVPRATPVIESVAGLWETADWHEREVFDLFGIRFTNHPDLRRILLDDTWAGYPLRKDYVDQGHDVVKRPY